MAKQFSKKDSNTLVETVSENVINAAHYSFEVIEGNIARLKAELDVWKLRKDEAVARGLKPKKLSADPVVVKRLGRIFGKNRLQK